ncbi:MAG TPA: AtpZ/AtpI family protein [Candidatus Binatus sp.]|nr:AtpZ/AtpI family protein [Candidatus Binatus sp.]
MDHKNDNSAPNEPGKRPANFVQQSALGLELPFTFAGAVALGGFIGYFLDKWLHTGPWLMAVFGCFGFAAGILEIARRFRPKD